MLRLPNIGVAPCRRTTHLKVIVQKVTGMAASRIMTPKTKQKKYKVDFIDGKGRIRNLMIKTVKITVAKHGSFLSILAPPQPKKRFTG